MAFTSKDHESAIRKTRTYFVKMPLESVTNEEKLHGFVRLKNGP